MVQCSNATRAKSQPWLAYRPRSVALVYILSAFLPPLRPLLHARRSLRSLLVSRWVSELILLQLQRGRGMRAAGRPRKTPPGQSTAPDATTPNPFFVGNLLASSGL